ncbi:hypothetical protein KJA15_00265 [Patescibacteria group bacterium]|nr:hypothetical protein [Patescibacteria group bacterium]
MKLPITDKFLWDLFNAIEKISDVHALFAPRTLKEVWFPELYKARCFYRKKADRREFFKFIRYLKKKGYIKVKSLEPNEAIILTQKGIEKVLKTTLRLKEKRRRKDGKWIMVIFDIPEKKRNFRDLFRENLQLLGFKYLQKSIWVCPYDVLEEVQGLIVKYDLEKYVKTFLIEELELETKK